ncbi:MAG: trypsin-like peptidase domain-containing protein [Hyphomicrobiales bacterium]|nr:trypsin-like peptidase domain-containing protein [Hyphomicrobiales bacterium]MBV8827534.1 trypsin-like peptidase domain-containing protein [Hyphomicrobiales bacterium]
MNPLFARFLATVVIVLWGTTSLFAQQITEQKKTVAFAFGTVHLPKGDGTLVTTKMPLGTVFFVYYPDSRLGTDRGFGYVVTAKHVLKDGDGRYLKEISIRVNLKNSQEQDGVTNIDGIPVSDERGDLIWFHDAKDEAIDVAAFPLLPNENKVDFKTIPVSMFAEEPILREFKVSEGDAVYFIGLMAQYYGQHRNFPVVRRGALALMTDEKIQTATGVQKAYIAELVTWPGNSGSPVFLNLAGMRDGSLSLGSNFRFLGLLCGGFLDRRPGTVLDASQVVLGSGANIGVSYIVPADSLKAILESAPAREHRDLMVKQFLDATGSIPENSRN